MRRPCIAAYRMSWPVVVEEIVVACCREFGIGTYGDFCGEFEPATSFVRAGAGGGGGVEKHCIKLCLLAFRSNVLLL
jgi:hypothetical protein